MSDLIAKLEARAKRMDHAGDGLEYYSKMDAALDREVAAALRSMQAQEPDGFLDTRTGSLLHIVPADNAGRYRPLYAAPVSPAGLVERLARSLAEDYVGDDAKAEYRWENTDRIWRDGWMAKARQHLSALEPAAQPAQPEWRSIDSAPKDGSAILLLGVGGRAVVANWSGKWWVTDIGVQHNPQGWSPIPAAPSEGA